MRGDLARIIQITVVTDNLRDIRRGGACQRGFQVAAHQPLHARMELDKL
jgi:hypothetical protein